MNYIKRLQLELETQEKVNATLIEGITDIERYLNLDKFKHERWVNIDDIRLRLQETRDNADDILYR